MKIHIMGGPGSGKTAFAHCLSSMFHAPHYELDFIGWENGCGDERPLAARLEDAVSIAEQPRWITEGISLFWTDPLLHHADYIILLDISWRLAAWRIIRRHIYNSLHGTNRHAGFRKLFLFLKDTRNYYLSKNKHDVYSSVFTLDYLKKYEEKLFILRRNADQERLIRFFIKK